MLELLWLVLTLAMFVSDVMCPRLLLLAAGISVAGTHHPEDHEDDEADHDPQHHPGPPGHPGQSLIKILSYSSLGNAIQHVF